MRVSTPCVAVSFSFPTWGPPHFASPTMARTLTSPVDAASRATAVTISRAGYSASAISRMACQRYFLARLPVPPNSTSCTAELRLSSAAGAGLSTDAAAAAAPVNATAHTAAAASRSLAIF